jgi:hypothetical protein
VSFSMYWQLNQLQFERGESKGAISETVLIHLRSIGVGSLLDTRLFDAAQCPPEKRNPLISSDFQCFMSSTSTMCLPPAPWAAFSATKGAQIGCELCKFIPIIFNYDKSAACASLAIVILVPFILLCVLPGPFSIGL